VAWRGFRALHPASSGAVPEQQAVMKRILVALDHSARAPVVLTAARRMAELAGAQLVLYRAVNPVASIPVELLVDTEAEDLLIRDARCDLERLAADLPQSLIEQITAQFAVAADGICSIAKDQMVDLIVVGSHGYSGLDRLLGTTAAKVVNHADRNVLVVRTVL